MSSLPLLLPLGDGPEVAVEEQSADVVAFKLLGP